MNQNHHLSEKHSIGDTVGIRIHKVDRTNTDSNILPCKVLEIKKSNRFQIRLQNIFKRWNTENLLFR
jgi:hypothetical protein